MAHPRWSRALPALGLAAALALSACNDDRTGVRADMAHGTDDTDMLSAGPRTCSTSGSVHQLSNLTGQHAYPRIASNGIGYVVGWVSGIPGSPPTYRVDATITDKAGNKLGPNLPMSALPVADADPPSLAPITNGIAIAWTRLTGSATDIQLTTLDQSGQKLDMTGKACDPADTTCGIFPVTSSGVARSPYLERPFGDHHTEGPTENELGLAFIDARSYPCTTMPCPTANDVYWKRIQTNGAELLYEKKLTATPNARFASPRLAFDGVHQGVVWRDTTSGTADDLYFTTIDNMGQLSSMPEKIGSSTGSASTSTPDLVWTGAEYAIVSATGTDATAAILFQRQSATGTSTLGPKGVTFGGSPCAPAIAFDGEAYGIVYQEGCGKGGHDLAFVRVDANGTRLQLDGTSCGSSIDPACGVLQLTNNGAETAIRPEMVYGGDGSFAIVWMQGPEGPSLSPGVPLEVYFQRVDCK